MKNILKILTPENVYVEYELAGLGSRFAALFIDSLIQFGLIIAVAVSMLLGGVNYGNLKNNLLDESSFFIASGIVLIFVIFFGYFILLEFLMNGQTPGKKVMKIRVLSENGEPVGFFDTVLRNILRITDMLPFFYLAGACMILFTRHYKRIGDYAANTIVVRSACEQQFNTVEQLLENRLSSLTDVPQEANIYPVNDFEYGILREFLARNNDFGARRQVFIYHLNKYFLRKFHIENSDEDPIRFFTRIVKMNSGQ